jgi:Cft2 family RNA processing exonuclease
MLLEAFAVGRIQRVLEIGRHELDDLLTSKFSV